MKLDETVKNGTYFHRLISEGMFRFDRLNISGIDNEPVFKLNVPEIIEQETCLFHRDIANGDAYLDLLHSAVERSIAGKRSIPIVRFADGEYAFYRYSLACNGLYQQAVNVEAIKAVMPSHIKAMKINARVGKIAPLVFPGNIQKKERGFFSLLRKSKNDDSAIRFLEFLNAQRIELTVTITSPSMPYTHTRLRDVSPVSSTGNPYASSTPNITSKPSENGSGCSQADPGSLMPLSPNHMWRRNGLP